MRVHNEKMLPASYSIAGWPQWLCITFDTVCCITSTAGNTLSGTRAFAPLRFPKQHVAVCLSLGLILRSRTVLLVQEPAAVTARCGERC